MKPKRCMPLREYEREHSTETTQQKKPVVQTVDPAEQAKYRSFSADFYAGIEAGMNRVRGELGPADSAAEIQDKRLGIQEPVDELTGHNYDGIQEYDNPTPGWWYAIFVASILFGGFYLLVYHLAVPPLSVRHATAEAKHLDMQFAELNRLETGEPKVLAIMNEEAWLARGAAIFSGSCAICHSADGSGLIGPNLTDETYKNISSLMDIAALVSNGTPNGSMPAQKNLLNENEIALVTAYVASMRGKNRPTNPSVDPTYTGVPIAPWPTLDASGDVIKPSSASHGASNQNARLTSRLD